MGNVAIRVEQLSKKYQIGVFRHDTLRDRLAHGLNSFLRRNGKTACEGELWALEDVSFEVNHGEILGIIGRNGAGKSTLLKVLSRITEPTSGRVEIYGRVGSLLEVGTGFHPELSGRENIYLNGAILGMTHKEIDRKFDEIVTFAEVERFLDTPVKRYSSGMYVRLAFAVAAHLEPDILLVDEVLAVGDAAFQRKCLGKMGDVASEGRTVLFVSHNIAAVHTLCTRGLFLRNSTIWADDSIASVIACYQKTLEKSVSESLSDRKDRKGRGQIKLTRIKISRNDDVLSTTLTSGCAARFEFHVMSYQPSTRIGFTLYDHYGLPVVDFNTERQAPVDVYDSELGKVFICDIEELLLVPGRYRVDAAVWAGNELEDHVEGALFLEVEPQYLRGRPVALSGKWGNVHMHHQWRLPTQQIHKIS